MKILVIFMLILSSLSAGLANAKSMEIKSIVVEYYESTNSGIIRIPDCKRCDFDFYEFDNTLEVKKDRKKGSIKDLSKEYWKVNFYTVFIKPNSNKVLRIYY
ncbi:hypothetical protein HF888_04130 [Bermanella marisrubri]|uniref:Uncharacterized protein n=1 Tax=Bermanella marisrubri TaxID=207949 RepID=Q1MYS0_9GAMM|nr:hypothetical protein [Bermanella marisrubri]EAT11136.1 hypothetical protein RED65_05059 [Oceanobacter sp. RED65] [Bermanella marisrubri]QIZ83460.1 hypothetical protein HF888_04130 [Bermanella marisrubri]